MVLTIKKKFSYYRRFEKDIWGISIANLFKSHKVTHFFFNLYLKRKLFTSQKKRRYIYRVDIIDPKSEELKFKLRFITLRLVKLFYLTLNYKQFRVMARLAARKDGFFQNNFCSILEFRLASIYYRSNFLYSMFDAISFVKDKNVLVNNELKTLVNSHAFVGDILTLYKYKTLRYRIKSDFVRRLRYSGFVFNTPRYMYISYKLFFIILEKLPNDDDLVFPVSLDIYRVTGYY